jgi:ABC-type Fe3+/spermidine/putrescine transport system ATPase subunit
MALSDRIALLRAGRLEQVATPREIYSHPATAYTAEFIGQTNLLRVEVRRGLARAGALAWSAAGPEGSATFSLRPECIRLASAAQPAGHGAARFRATIRTQTFGGATDLLEVACSDGRVLRVRIPARGTLEGDAEFEFSADDAVRVKGEEN